MPARAIMFQGTGSDVGKSLIVAGLARALVKRGLKVAPFKPQNMSNNAAVTADGGEIGRAQALQARAARAAPRVHMNPVLLKPQSEVGAQIVVQGKVYGRASAAEYQQLKPELMPFVLDSFTKLKAEADIVLVEGAGSASEINLRANDIANMGFARAADVPVVLIGDIDRGGVIASLAGVLYVYYNRFVNPVSASFQISVEVTLMAIVGGSGTIIGPFIGSAIFLGLRNWVSSFFELHASVMGLVFIATVLWAPEGIVGIVNRLRGKRKGEAS